jgi:hypothetical protein
MNRAELAAIYRRAIYRVQLADELALDLAVDAPCPALDRWLAARGAARWGLLTAANPGSQRLSERDNETRLAQLLSRLRERGCELRAGVGLDPAGEWPAEPSFFVLDADEDALARWAAEFGQAAFLAGALGEAPRLVFVEPLAQAPPTRSL